MPRQIFFLQSLYIGLHQSNCRAFLLVYINRSKCQELSNGRREICKPANRRRHREQTGEQAGEIMAVCINQTMPVLEKNTNPLKEEGPLEDDGLLMEENRDLLGEDSGHLREDRWLIKEDRELVEEYSRPSSRSVSPLLLPSTLDDPSSPAGSDVTMGDNEFLNSSLTPMDWLPRYEGDFNRTVFIGSRC
jgi:hypothetical protein